MKPQVISFHCILKNKLGHVISSSFNRDVVNDAFREEQLPDLFRGLQNANVGEQRQIQIGAERAYGFYDTDLVSEIPRSELRRGFELNLEDTIRMSSLVDGSVRQFRVIEVSASTVTVDGNHPLAGQDLIFEIDFIDVRDLQNGDRSTARERKHAYH